MRTQQFRQFGSTTPWRSTKASGPARSAARRGAVMRVLALVSMLGVLSGMPDAAAQRASSSGAASAQAIQTDAVRASSIRSARPVGADASRAAAVQWLERIRVAAQQQNYKGVFVYQRGAFVQSSRIEHYATRAEGRYERIESLDGKPRQMLRHNDDLYTFVPERHLCVVEKRQNEDTFPALFAAGLGDVLSVYEPKLAGADRVAGIDSQVIELAPKDGYRFAYRLWADAKTGLLLRTQTLGGDGQVLEQLAFSQVSIGVPANVGPISNGIREIASGVRERASAGNAVGGTGSAAGWTIVRPPIGPVDIEAQGWTLPLSVPGFRKIRELRRPMAASDAGTPPIPVDQAVFSDGLATISVFIEPVAHNSRKAGIGSSGATHALVLRRGNYWLTLLGEVPEATLQRFASGIAWKAPR